MRLISNRRNFWVIGILFFILALFSIIVINLDSIKVYTNDALTKIILLTPPRRDVKINSENTSYKVEPKLSDFSKNIINELELFQENGVFVHNKISVNTHTLRSINIIFSQEKQFWPLQIKKDSTEVSAFDFSVDGLGNGTLIIWLNPNEISNQEQLSLVANRAFFSSIYIITHWETYLNPSSGYYEYLARINNELKYSSVDNRPIVVH